MPKPTKHTVMITIEQASKLLGVHKSTLSVRMKANGWTLQEAIDAGGSQKRKIAVGDKFGHLTVIEVLSSKRGGNARVVAECECGAHKETLALQLRSRNVVSCGKCDLGKELHGRSGTSTYRCWSNMKERCNNPNRKDYPQYGGRGIQVCDAWMKSFTAFLRDMGERPEGLSLDRTDVNGNYEPGNCKWATKSEQSSNRRPYRHFGKYTRLRKAEITDVV